MRRSLLASLALTALSAAASALEVPYLSARVNDYARLLDAATVARLEQTLKEQEKKTRHQFAILIVPSLEGEGLEHYTLKVARAWKLGRVGRNDGILLFVARDERKIRIEVGYGLEGALPDALCGRIIYWEIAPRFRAGDYGGGITAGANAILAALNGTYPPPVRSSGRSDLAAMGILSKILASCFLFGLFGAILAIGIGAPVAGWFLNLFLTVFFGSLVADMWGDTINAVLLGYALIGFPILRLIISRTNWGREMAKQTGSSGGYVYTSGSGWSFTIGGGDGGGFSGGGGSFGGGGASGSW